jgi:hypothetical protein
MARLIRASEVGDYVYCHRAWWLRVVEGRVPERSERLQTGTFRHRRHGAQVAASRILLIGGLLALGAALVLLLI